MKPRAFIFILILLTLQFYSQTNFKYKSLTDSSFIIGDKIITPSVLFALSGSSWTFQPFIDSVEKIALFLKKNVMLKIELGGYTDGRGNKEKNKQLAYLRVQHIKDYLIKAKGIDSLRIKIKGYGDLYQIVPQNKINLSKTKQEKETYYAKNRHTEIKILSLD